MGSDDGMDEGHCGFTMFMGLLVDAMISLEGQEVQPPQPSSRQLLAGSSMILNRLYLYSRSLPPYYW